MTLTQVSNFTGTHNQLAFDINRILPHCDIHAYMKLKHTRLPSKYSPPNIIKTSLSGCAVSVMLHLQWPNITTSVIAETLSQISVDISSNSHSNKNNYQ